MSKKALQIIAIIAAVFLFAFAIFFTVGLYFRFKEPLNALALFSLVIGAPLACVVWFFKKREQNTEELLKRINEEKQDEENQDLDENIIDSEDIQSNEEVNTDNTQDIEKK